MSWFGFRNLCALVVTAALHAQPIPRVEVSGISLHHLVQLPQGSPPVRLVKDPRTKSLYVLKMSGDILQLQINPGTNSSTTTLIYSAADHGQTNAMGLAIGSDGVFYIVGNQIEGDYTRATIMKGVPAEGTNRVWRKLAQTEPCPLGKSAYDHQFNGIVVSPDGVNLFLNSGSRTDHGEIRSANGLFPGLRETGITSCILKLPSNGESLVLWNDRQKLRDTGYLFAEGVRNTYDLRFSPAGDLFGPDNGPERNMPDELNWLREGHHYGFPWRMGAQDNPQQFSNYDPATDKLLDPKFFGGTDGEYRNDPTFPKPPGAFTDPIENLGPDADSFRDANGQIKDASELNTAISTFTPHRSPLGLVFDEDHIVHPDYLNDAFVLSWSVGDPTGDTIQGPFKDEAADLLHLHLVKTGDQYQLHAKRIVTGFFHPIDAEIIGNKIYVIDFTLFGLWEVTLPKAPTYLSNPTFHPEGKFSFQIENPATNFLRLETSTNFLDWLLLNRISGPSVINFTETNTTHPFRFYRARPE